MAAVNTTASDVAGFSPPAPITIAAHMNTAESVLQSRGASGALSQRCPGAAR